MPEAQDWEREVKVWSWETKTWNCKTEVINWEEKKSECMKKIKKPDSIKNR
jgi:hypothetical protein